MSGSSVYRRGFHPALVITAIITTALLLFGPAWTAQAEISWRSGVEMGDRPTGDAAFVALSELSKSGSGQHIVVQFSKPVTLEEKAALETLGVGLHSYLGSNAFFATLKTGGLETTDLRAAPTLISAMPIELEWKLAPSILANEYPDYAIAVDADTKEALVAAYVMFHRDIPLDKGWALARAHKATVVSEIVSINMLVVEMPLKALLDLAAEDAVMWVEPPLPFMTETNDSNSVVTQADSAQTAPYNLDGSGINVLVYDAAYALASHSDFSGRLTVRDSSGLGDHATHVSGTIGGDGSGNSNYEGMAPGVTIQSYGFQYDGSGTFLYTNPGDLESDYNQAINTYGVDISNNSIGSNIESNGFNCAYQGDYGATAALIDEIVGGSLGAPFRIVWANGNERGGSRCDVEGYGDYYSVPPPAGAKNQIAVGALNSDNDSMTYFSSWGPTDDGRMKPDISGPGCQSGGDGGVTSCSSSGGYTTMCGTSMASPTVTGCLALLLEDFRAQYPAQNDPRNSTLKILLAHNAVDLGNTGPDYQYGFGSIRIVDTIDFMRGGEFEENSVSQGGTVTYQVVVPGGTSELKITMAWDDVAGTPNVNPNLVNDLDLVVMSPSSVRAYPWTLNPTSPSSSAVRNQADHTNNIEQVLVDNPEAGTWTVTVQGYSVPDGPQSFSICGSPTLGVAGPADCNNNGVPDDQDISGGTSLDCNGNGVPDECDISYGTSTDCNSNGIPDDCEPGGGDDCNNNGQSDLCDIALGTSEDCNANGIPDDCEVGSGASTISFTLDTNPGWSIEGLWGFGTPTGGGGQYGGPDPSSAYTGSNVYGYNLSGDYENSLPERHLTTTAIDCSNIYDVSLSFRRWLGVERSTYDHAYIRVSNDGSSWTTIWQNPDSATEDASWTLQSYDISAVADYEGTVYIRWTQGTTDSSWQYCGWNIDDVEVTGTSAGGGPGDCNDNGVPDECDITDGTSEDCNSNGVPDECDIADGTSLDGNGNGIPDECESVDCNNNGVPDAQDISEGTSQDCDGNGVPDECQTDSDGDGLIDPCDGCPADPDKTVPGNCGCGTPDTDSDGDGVPDCNDGCPNDPNKIAPGDCGCGVPDVDSDGDGVADCADGCPNDPNKIAPGDCGCGVLDVDSDGDGVADCIDGCPSDPNKIAPGECGCGVPDVDSDGDGTLDCNDGCPDDPNKTDPGICGCGVPDGDSDGDGWIDCDDNCPGTYNPGQEDCDNDGIGDACAGEPDCNLNGIPDSCDITDGTSQDTNSNGIPDECEVGPEAKMESGTVTAGGSATSVALVNTYVSPVVVCAVNYSANAIPVVARVSNVTTNSFDVRLQNPSGSAVSAEEVSYLVMEEGVWTIDGVNCEAQTYLSTVTDENGSWVGETQAYGQGYTTPVVLGQVMSENDSDWSVFWSYGSSRSSAPSASVLKTGKTVCEDTDITRADETIGFIVFEAGHGTIGGVDFEAVMGSDLIEGVTNSPPYTYTFNTAFASAPAVNVVTQAGMDGSNGGWAQTHGTPASATNLYLSIDEDQIMDTERGHITEQVAYAVFETAMVYPAGMIDCNNNGVPDSEDISGGTSQDCDGNGVPDECQADSDGDGVIDPCDGCPADPDKLAPGDCGCGTPDTDSDGDGTADCMDGCPSDPNKIAPGDCGCGTPDTDSDGDGVADCIDGCPSDPNKFDPGICGCGVPDTDGDGDGWADCVDNCPATYNPGQEDCDNDGIGDACAGEPDCNSNGTPDSCDIADGTSEDTDLNGIPDECETGPQARMETGTVTVGGTPVTVNLNNTYTSAVVVCSADYNNNSIPIVTRVSNVTANSFDVRLQNPSDSGVAAETVSYIVMEEGTWTIDGVNCEAQTYLSTVTDENNSWNGESQTYGQSYTNPVVLGQVMTENDPDWSAFWCAGSARSNIPTATALITGKEVAEDPDTTRANETVGFIVFEAGHGTIGGSAFEAKVGADSVRGPDNGGPYAYTFDTAFGGVPAVAVITMAAMDGGNGGWANTVGGVSASGMDLWVDEDQVNDNERRHTTEQVGYVVFQTSVTVN